MSFLVIIPENFSSDLHICCKCKAQYTVLDQFLEHKATPCISNTESSKDGENTKTNSNNMENTSLASSNGIKTLGDIKITFDEAFEFRGELLTEEQDVVDLLANQLSQQDSKSANDGHNNAGSSVNIASNPNDNISTENNERLMPKRKPKRPRQECRRFIFMCSQTTCNYKTNMKKDIIRHERIHTGERPFKCGKCGKAYSRRDKLLLHDRTHSGDKRHKCPKCPYAAVDSGSVVKHLRIHFDERPYRCLFCTYRSHDSSKMTVHMRSHTGDSPFVCSHSDCRSAFKTSSDLKRHISIHCDVKPFACDLCSYKSAFKGCLRKHVVNHHPDGKVAEYRCTECQEVFSSIRKLNTHSKTHLNSSSTDDKKKKSKDVMIGSMNKAHKCQLCNASFVCWDSLKSHERFHKKTKLNSKTDASQELLVSSQYDKSDFEMSKEAAIMDIEEITAKQGSLAEATPFPTIDESLRADEIGTEFPLSFSHGSRQFMDSSSAYYPDELSNPPLGLT